MMTTRQFIERGLKVGLATLAIHGIAAPPARIEASGPCPKDTIVYTVQPGDRLLDIGRAFRADAKDIAKRNGVGDWNKIWPNQEFEICTEGPIGGPNVLVIPGVTPRPVIENKNAVQAGSSPEYPIRLVDGLYFTFAPNQELWVALDPDQFDGQHNRIGLQVETVGGRSDSMQGLVFAPDRVPAVVSWFKTQGDMPAPTAQLLAKRSNNDEDWNKIGADFGNLWFPNQNWLLRLKNTGREGAGPVEPVTFRLGIKPFYQ